MVRLPKRGAYDKETIYAIVDASLICHVGLIQDGKPFVIPTLHARDGDNLLLHGSAASRMIKHAGAGHDLCITITLVDGLVLARSVFHHSANYRSAVLFGQGHMADAAEKNRYLKIFTDKLIPGRWDDARQPTELELKATSVVVMPIASASAKVRVGPPGDDDEDYALPVWAGVLPMQTQWGAPVADPLLRAGIDLPDYVKEYIQ
ncbi:MAG: pyridoxamine 5'-phosphate oxidase family protein [Caldilineaceae bacterium]